jgi:DsbC/DsbD-like thiol-disulfide interchange protein
VNTDVDLQRHAISGAYQQHRATSEQSGLSVRLIGLLLGLSLASPPGPVCADSAPGPDTRQGLVQARLVAEGTSLQRDQSGWLAVQLTMKPGWHTYWRNPGDSGLATTIKWGLPRGVTVGPTVWPRPERFFARSIVGYGYSADVALLTTVTLPARFASDRITIRASVSWLACSDICIPGSETLKLTLSVSNTVPKADLEQVHLFAKTRRRIPQPAPFEATFAMDRDQIRLGFPRAAFSGTGKLSMVFYPFDNSLIEHGAPQSVRQDKQRVELTLRRSPVSNDQLGTLDGLLIVEETAGGNVKSSAFDVFGRRAEGAFQPLQAP